MSIRSQYLQRRTSAAQAMRLVRNGDFIIVPTGVGEPPTLLTALSEQRRDFHDVKVAQILAVRKYGYIDPSTVDHVRHDALFYGAAKPSVSPLQHRPVHERLGPAEALGHLLAAGAQELQDPEACVRVVVEANQIDEPLTDDDVLVAVEEPQPPPGLEVAGP